MAAISHVGLSVLCSGNMESNNEWEQRLAVALARHAVQFWEWKSERRYWALADRLTAHIALALAAAIYLFLRSLLPISFASVSFAHTAYTNAEQPPLDNAHIVQANWYSAFGHSLVIKVEAQPHTEIPKRPRLGIITYTVQLGDTVQDIAARFDLEPSTIMWANPAVENAPDLLRIGQELLILPVDGVYHTVKEGETLESIAKKYKVEVEAITSCPYNSLQPPDFVIEPGMKLIVPGGQKPWVPKVVTSYTGPIPEGARGTGLFQWPVLGYITQGYWYGHRAIDIGVPEGTAVHAADSGFVSFAGWTDVGYGYLIVIDHANGFTTYYAHLSNFYVTAGQKVGRGQVIGATGNTGWSTGPHLHFEIRYLGTPQNPRIYLP